QTGTREEWLKARLELLEAEKELTRRGDELAQRRQELPWVRVEKEYRFDTDEGSASLADGACARRMSVHDAGTCCASDVTAHGRGNEQGTTEEGGREAAGAFLAEALRRDHHVIPAKTLTSRGGAL